MATTGEGTVVVSFGEHTLDLRTGELFGPDTQTVLPQQLFQLLATLVARRGALVTRDELRHQLWPDDTFVDFEPSLNAAVRRLRDVLGDSADTPRFIETLPRRGYRFIAPVADGRADSPPRPPIVEAGAAPVPAGPWRLPSWVPVGALLLTAALGSIAWVMSRSPAHGVEGALARPALTRLTNIGTVRLASLSPDGRRVAYVRADGARQSLWLRTGDGSHVPLLSPVDGAFRSVTFGPQDFVYYTLFLPDHTHISLYRVSTTGATPELVGVATGRVAFSPDGRRYASVFSASLARAESRVVVDEVAGGTTRVVATCDAPSSFLNLKPAWSADGRQLAVPATDDAGRLELVVVNLEGAPRQRFPLPLVQITDVLWLADGTLVVAARERTGLPQRLWRLTLPAMALQPLTHDLNDYALAGILPGARTLAAVRGESAQGLWMVDVPAHERPRQVATDSGNLQGFEGVAWSPDGQIVYAAMDAGNVDLYAVDPLTGHRRRLTSDPAADFHPDVSADGRLVTFVSERGGAQGVWVMAVDGTGQRRLTTGADTLPSFSPDGRWVVLQRDPSANTAATLWRVPIEGGTAARVGPLESIRPAVSPDGGAVAHYWMTSARWNIAITPIDSELPARAFPIARTHTERVIRWAPDGSGLAFVDAAGGVANVWFQPLDGGAPRALTNLNEGSMPAFDWSPDGARIAWTRVTEVRDVVTIPIDPGM